MKLQSIHFYTYDALFKQPIITPKVTLKSRKALIIECIDDKGRHYFSESNAFETNWYDEETIASVYKALKHWFHHHVKNQNLNDYHEALDTLRSIEHQPAARSTAVIIFFQAFHDLPSFSVDYGATISGMTDEKLSQLKQTKPKRVKLKWSEHVLSDLSHLQSLPFQPLLALDANESLSSKDFITLKEVHHEYPIIYIEEPFKDLKLTEHINVKEMPSIAIDEKARTLEKIKALVSKYPIDTVVLKPFRLGGIDKVLEAMKYLQKQRIKVVIGGMYEYGLSRYFTAYLSRFADYPGDVTPYGYYFDQEYTAPNGLLKKGRIEFAPPNVNVSQLQSYE